MAAPRTTPSIHRTLRILVGACFALLLAPALAVAACPKVERAQLAAAVGFVSGAAASPTTADANAIVGAARRRCATARFAYAVARVSRANPNPGVGTRARVSGIDLLATPTNAGVVWRLDVVRATGRLARTRSAASAGRQRAWSFPTRAGSALVWSDDPTRPAWNPTVQAAAAATLARARMASVRRDAGPSVRAFAVPARRRTVARLPLLDQLTLAARLAVGARGAGDIAADRVARTVASTAYRGVARATNGGWSRIDGSWSTVGQHRALLVRTRALLRRYPNAATARVAVRLAHQLTDPAEVRFRALPTGTFYPWPRDGAFDSQSVTVHVDKPGTVRIEVYAGAGDAPIRVLEHVAQPGDIAVAWDGAATDGTIQEPGDYVYVVTVDDIAGRQTRTPGLEPFRIARDTIAPAVRSATVSYLTSGSAGPRLAVAWNVDEPISPVVRTQLVLSRNGKQVTLLLDSAASTRVARRPIRLGAGTWTASFVFTDGSGNAVTHPVRTLVVR